MSDDNLNLHLQIIAKFLLNFSIDENPFVFKSFTSLTITQVYFDGAS